MKGKCAIETVPGIGRIAQRFGLRLILQFGSPVTRMTHDRSDLDLAVQLDSFPVSLQTILEIQEALQVQFTGSEIDLAIVNRANPLFLQKIVEPCRLLFGTPQDFARLRLHAFKAYQDFLPYLEMEHRYVPATGGTNDQTFNSRQIGQEKPRLTPITIPSLITMNQKIGKIGEHN